MKKAESDVGGSLNDGLNDLCDVFIFAGVQMIASYGLLESNQGHGVGNKRLARSQIHGNAVNMEARQFMKAQMRNGSDDGIHAVDLKSYRRWLNLLTCGLELCEEVMVNFAPTHHIVGVAWHTAAIFAHPLQIMRIVSANLKPPSIPRPQALALRAKHLVAALRLVDENLAIWARLSVLLQQSHRSKGVGIANMRLIIPGSLEFPAMRTGVLVASGTLPSGRHKAIAVGISTAMHELLNMFNVVGTLSHQLVLGSVQVILECPKLLDLSDGVLYLCIDAGNESVMRNSSLCGGKHGLFLSEENILLVLCEVASEKGLGKSEMLNLRMCE